MLSCTLICSLPHIIGQNFQIYCKVIFLDSSTVVKSFVNMSNWSVLFSLPDHLILDVTSQWIEMEDFSRVDSAMCNITQRDPFLANVVAMKNLAWTLTRVKYRTLSYARLRGINFINTLENRKNVNDDELNNIAFKSFLEDAYTLMIDNYLHKNFYCHSKIEEKDNLDKILFVLKQHDPIWVPEFDWSNALRLQAKKTVQFIQSKVLDVQLFKSVHQLRRLYKNDKIKFTHEVERHQREAKHLGFDELKYRKDNEPPSQEWNLIERELPEELRRWNKHKRSQMIARVNRFMDILSFILNKVSVGRV